ncbi:MAG TPA: hypothetical protein DEE98_08970 [Elusimicrobia bacterium]|nr:MAG: hypothetical protein A2204_00220 [Elusimicrobia bacterium RIFOXYA1_FULL_47_7]OGS09952.1 MAG: hypothetical protein A2386_01395 [Elusimicrobia bacterium RIFOXYB1_FULL_48_9]OGS15730.1 MAG: hypothetical protein A2251_08580 [Elusimicrobia bacterium RIFOXYA2_FULL_47_53]OGS31031.1 MAG: hypothetical protein A2323_06900 [Elusimicrobia bacterium RIFOXYB2_FULL_46_23]HBU70494.1 hypothetical protein [Elusimicrobiota bacterium]
MNNEQIGQIILEKLQKEDKVLDVGCGAGYLCNYFAKKLQKPVAGLDISNKGFRQAHDLCKKFNTCHLIKCLSGKAESIAGVVGEMKFDAVVFVHSFHHVKDVKKALGQVKVALSGRGQIIIAEYSPEAGKSEDKCRRFTIKHIIGLLINSGFSNIYVEQPQKGFFLICANPAQYGVKKRILYEDQRKRNAGS